MLRLQRSVRCAQDSGVAPVAAPLGLAASAAVFGDLPLNLIHADCLDAMAAMEPESVDAVVTDPPYGIRFMGKAWDGAAIEEQARTRAGHKQPRHKNGTA